MKRGPCSLPSSARGPFLVFIQVIPARLSGGSFRLLCQGGLPGGGGLPRPGGPSCSLSAHRSRPGVESCWTSWDGLTRWDQATRCVTCGRRGRGLLVPPTPPSGGRRTRGGGGGLLQTRGAGAPGASRWARLGTWVPRPGGGPGAEVREASSWARRRGGRGGRGAQESGGAPEPGGHRQPRPPSGPARGPVRAGRGDVCGRGRAGRLEEPEPVPPSGPARGPGRAGLCWERATQASVGDVSLCGWSGGHGVPPGQAAPRRGGDREWGAAARGTCGWERWGRGGRGRGQRVQRREHPGR